MPGLLSSRTSAGFTLIELMIVISLIALLAGILVPSFHRARLHGQLSSCSENLRNLASAVAMYQTDNAGLLPLEASVAVGGSTSAGITNTQTQFREYVSRTPLCPAERAKTYSYRYYVGKTAAGRPWWSIYCYSTPSIHQDLGCPAYYPRYSQGQAGLANGLVLKP